MEFGLWFEPEMINPEFGSVPGEDPDWILPRRSPRTVAGAGHQLVLDLARDEVRSYLFDQIGAVLSDSDQIGYVKWDHNRDLLEAGSGLTGGAPAVHRQTLGFYRLLDDLRERHPLVQWESCASGGGRIDLGVLERAERVWTSDMTDALAPQSIQRWTETGETDPEQLRSPRGARDGFRRQTHHTVTPEVRARPLHSSAPSGSSVVLFPATEDDLDRLREWVSLFQRFRPLLHTGRTIRIDPSDPAVQINGVIASDRTEALFAHVQLAESAHNRGVAIRIPRPGTGASIHRAVGRSR